MANASSAPYPERFGYDDLNARVGRQASALHCYLAEQTRADPQAAFMDAANLTERPILVDYMHDMTALLTADEHFEEAQRTATTTFLYAHAVSRYVLGMSADMDLTAIYAAEASSGDKKRLLQLTGSDYLDKKPQLQSTTERFMPVLDRSGRYGSIALYMAGAVFKSIDEVTRKRVIDRQATVFTQMIESYSAGTRQQ